MNPLNRSQEPGKGRILRVKSGYNPNSSSMGSMIFVLPASLLAATICFGTVSGMILSAVLHDKDKDGLDPPEARKEGQGQQ